MMIVVALLLAVAELMGRRNRGMTKLGLETPSQLGRHRYGADSGFEPVWFNYHGWFVCGRNA
jgi:hypothetical protein